jgi:hypothetical protein
MNTQPKGKSLRFSDCCSSRRFPRSCFSRRCFSSRCLCEKGSLALEQVLFIGAIITMSAGLFAFYGNLSTYFSSVDISNVQNQVPGNTGTTGSTSNQ